VDEKKKREIFWFSILILPYCFLDADEAIAASMANLLNTCIANINNSPAIEQVAGYETQFYTDINNLSNAC
jgi:hypothetical protein